MFTLTRSRIESLNKLLNLYFETYLSRVLKPDARSSGIRIYPGYHAVMKHLSCSRVTAMDYLYSLRTLRHYFNLEMNPVKKKLSETEKRQPKTISDGELRKLVDEVENLIVKAVRSTKIYDEDIRKNLNLAEADPFLEKAFKVIEDCDKVFNSKQVANLFYVFKQFLI